MFVQKKTKLRLAYAVLAFIALAVGARDAHLRSTASISSPAAERSGSQTPALPLAILPIADSPFPEARAHRAGTTANTRASNDPVPTPKPEIASGLQDVFFLTVAVKVESKEGPVAFLRGTRVRLLRQQDGRLLVRHNRTDFLIEKSQVTDDLNALTALARNSS